MAKKTKIIPITSVEEFKSIVDEITITSQVRDSIALRQERAIARIRARFEKSLGSLNASLDTMFKRATKFAVLKRDELIPKGLQSSCTALSLFGFQKGKPALALVEGFTWADVVDAIQIKIDELKGILASDKEKMSEEDRINFLAEIQKWNELIVTKTEPVKDQIKALLSDEERAKIGTEIQQKETFWVEPKTEKEAKPVEEAA